MNKLQLRVLFRQFLFRIVDVELIAPQGDLEKLLGHFASLLVFFSLIMALAALFSGGPPPGPRGVAMSWGVQHFLISTTMLVVGLFAILSWDSCFPDRRDMMVLAPLPLSPGTLLLAKISAVAAALAAAVLALNIFDGIAWPLFWIPAGAGPWGFLRSLAAYWITTFAAGIFIFGSVLGLQGLAAQILSRRMFLRFSAFLQMFAFIVFLSVYFLEPHWAYPQALGADQNQAALAWLPSYWFLALFQQLNGSMHPAVIRLARRALIGCLVAIAGSGIAFLLCYLRTLRRIVEEPDIMPTRRGIRWSLPLGNSTQTAIAQFSIRTLLRSRQHRAIVCFYLGVGFGIVILYLKSGIAQKTLKLLANDSWHQPGVPLLASSIVVICGAVLGTRVAFSMPTDIRANWIFRLLPLQQLPDCISGARRGLLLLACLPACLASAVLFLSIWPWRPALLHSGILALLSLALAQASMLAFRKIPFTCSYLPGKANNVYLAVWSCTMLGIPLLDLLVRAAWRTLQSVKGSVMVMVGLAFLAAVLRWVGSYLNSKSEPAGLRFEEAPKPAIFALDLHRDGELIPYGSNRQ